MRYTPTTQQSLYREGIHIKSLTRFFRLQDRRFQATGHKAQAIRVTGYLMLDNIPQGERRSWRDNQYFGSNGFHHPWRSTACEIYPIIKIEVLE